MEAGFEDGAIVVDVANADGGVASVDRDAAFREFFVREYPKLAGFCASCVGDATVGEDLAQEALVRTWGRWIAVRQPHAYAYLVATNLVRRHWQQSGRERETFLVADVPVTPDSDATALRDLVERLPDRLRAPTLLHYYGDLSVSEIATVLYRPVGTIKRRVHEARRQLADEYGGTT